MLRKRVAWPESTCEDAQTPSQQDRAAAPWPLSSACSTMKEYLSTCAKCAQALACIQDVIKACPEYTWISGAHQQPCQNPYDQAGGAQH